MGRPAGSKNRPKKEASHPADHNQAGMSDEQNHALTMQHKGRYEAALAAKKKADADFKNACKLAKAELGASAVADIKLLIELESEDSDKPFQAELERRLKVARWAGLDLGHQADLFAHDRPSIRDRAFEEGKREGMAGNPSKPPANYSPGSEGHDGWMDGWHAGQAAIIKIKPTSNLQPNPDRDASGPDDFEQAASGDDESWPDDAAVAAKSTSGVAAAEAN